VALNHCRGRLGARTKAVSFALAMVFLPLGQEQALAAPLRIEKLIQRSRSASALPTLIGSAALISIILLTLSLIWPGPLESQRIPGAHQGHFPSSSFSGSFWSADTTKHTPLSDREGHFEFSPIPAGHYRILGSNATQKPSAEQLKERALDITVEHGSIRTVESLRFLKQ
jgi:hypothetical protein